MTMRSIGIDYNRFARSKRYNCFATLTATIYFITNWCRNQKTIRVKIAVSAACPKLNGNSTCTNPAIVSCAKNATKDATRTET